MVKLYLIYCIANKFWPPIHAQGLLRGIFYINNNFILINNLFMNAIFITQKIYGTLRDSSKTYEKIENVINWIKYEMSKRIYATRKIRKNTQFQWIIPIMIYMPCKFFKFTEITEHIDYDLWRSLNAVINY